jgi:hypothetical protein
VPFSGGGVVREKRKCLPDDLLQIPLDGAALARGGKPIAAKQQLVPDNGRDRSSSGVLGELRHHARVGLRPQRFGDDIRVQQVPEAHHEHSRPGDRSRRLAKSASVIPSRFISV